MSITVKDISEYIRLDGIDGNKEAVVNDIIKLDIYNANINSLMWVHPKNNHLIKSIKYGIVICNKVNDLDINQNCTYLYTDSPRRTFQEILTHFFLPNLPKGISDSSVINKNVSLGEDIFIGENVVIEAGCKIGNNTIINHNTVVKSNTIIGNNVTIGSNNVIGGVGFGYEKDETGRYIFIPHIGNVIIGNEVEIGNCTTIDKAVLGSTIIRSKVKIDNLVHIAHGVDIGENSLIIANSMIAGSVKIGRNSWIAPSSSILNKKTIGNNAVIGMGAVVLKDVNENSIIVGNPGKELKKKTQ